MTEHIKDDTPNTTTEAHSMDDIARLEKEVDALKEEIEAFESEKERIRIEAKLSIEDAQLARSFSRKNYTPLLNELFEAPSKKLRRQSFILFMLSILSIGVLLSHNLYPNLFSHLHKTPSNTDTNSLHEKIDALEKTITSTHHLIESNHASVLVKLQALNATTAETKTSTNNTTEEKNPAVVASPLTEKEKTIRQQAKKISEYVQRASTQKGFPKDFKNNKTSLAQLYLIVMQHANKEAVYYEAYLEAMRSLNINNHIIPKDIHDLIQLDTDFLQATASAYIITTRKQQQQWRYRESDQLFSNYYNPNLGYDLGPWQIVNEKKDYKHLPKIFALNMQRVLKQLSHNNKHEFMNINDRIFYHAYQENNKNIAFKKLLGASEVSRTKNMVNVDTNDIAIPFNKDTITQLQHALAEKGLMSVSVINGIAGPKTKQSVRDFQQSNALPSNGKISIDLLNSLNITTSYQSLL